MNKTTGETSPAVLTASGPLQGFQENGIFNFLGVPYASPPVGELRWRPPQPLQPWQGMRRADTFGPMACQITLSAGREEENNLAESEDCLYLNVWTPSVYRDDRLPVMVWIHGGGYMNGSGALHKYHGVGLAQKGVVLVTFNYRLGPLGSLVHADLEVEADRGLSGNYGFLDQVAALEWVQENIAGFGGDPDNVTIFGQSAGAMSAGLQCSSPRARGLFHKAICQSGGLLAVPREIPYDEALKDGLELQKALGVSSIAEMRKIPAEEINLAARELAAGDKQPDKLRFAPVIDEINIKDQEKTLGTRAEFPLITGSNKDEATFFLALMPPLTTANYQSVIERIFGEQAPQVLAAFPVKSDEEARQVFTRLRTDSLFTAPVREMAEALRRRGGQVYVYRFNRVSPGNRENGLGASHGEEIPYIFGHAYGEGYNEVDNKVSEVMKDYWVQFARTGNPNREGLPDWPRFTAEARTYLEFDDTISVRYYADIKRHPI